MVLFILMSNAADSNATATWSTWEELLLAFAVKRHGLKDWDAVAMELQSRHHDNSLFTSEICRQKYRNLRKRFAKRQNNHNQSAAGSGGGKTNESAYSSESDDDDNTDVLAGGGSGGEGVGVGGESFSWLEDLRKLRVAELKKEVQRYDLSIESLQMKVRKMEDEREKSLHSEGNKPDLDGEMKDEISENDKNNGNEATAADVAGEAVSGEDENRSFNESNSTENRRTGLTKEPDPVEVKPDSELIKPVGREDSCNDSSDRKASHELEKDGIDSAAESKEGSQGTKDSSDVQSSASLKIRKHKRISDVDGGGGGGGGVGEAAPATVPREKDGGVGVKAEPLFGVLDIIRSHKHGGVFKRRLESQKTDKYKNMIRQHVDLEKIQSRLEEGSYSSCPTKFYVDLLLLFNNAIVFFPKTSSESRAARELRPLVMKHLKKNSPRLPREPLPHPQPQPQPKSEPEPERSDSLLTKQKSTAPIIVCKKRSSISGKPSPSVNKVEKHDGDKPSSNSKLSIKSTLSNTSNEEDGSSKLKVKEKPVTGARSVRKSIKGRSGGNHSHSGPAANLKPSSSSQQRDTSEKPDTSKAGDHKKKAEANAIVKKKGAADFLKRIKKNETAKGTLVEALKNSGESLKSGKKDHHFKKSDDRKDAGRASSKSGGGGGGAKHAKEESSPSRRGVGRPPKKGKEVLKGKRGRDGGEEDESSKRPIKRSRR